MAGALHIRDARAAARRLRGEQLVPLQPPAVYLRDRPCRGSRRCVRAPCSAQHALFDPPTRRASRAAYPCERRGDPRGPRGPLCDRASRFSEPRREAGGARRKQPGALMEAETKKVRAAVVQASSIPFDSDACVEKAVRLTADAAAKGARVVVFPEAFVGG